ncbi:MAG: S-adenosylmethionine decarboxylase [Candidatus Shapirobacteria bacterium]|jgi:S-adenosylmethionine/arginine decarboxylase-like enzyme
MNNFPFYNHWQIEIFVKDSQKIDEAYVDSLAKFIIDSLKLNVVSTTKHYFPSHDGLTKIYVLSQSHLVIHTWPEFSALHFDLMTCSPTVIDSDVKKIFSLLPHTNPPIFR